MHLGRSALIHRVLPLFRSPAQLSLNRAFLRPHPTKAAVLEMLAYGLQGEWGSTFPPPNRPAANYLGTPDARRKCRLRFQSEVAAGRMIGGPGWTAEAVRWFLNGDFFITPCGAVPKGDDPHGRIVHNYSHEFNGISINSVLLDNSVQYISFKARVELLSQVSWYFKVDLKNGYRQVPVNPKDWHTQVYSLGPTEFYVDLAMPFGKANSSKKFCAWTDLWFSSFAEHFLRTVPFHSVLGSYVDDAFGGANSQARSKLMMETLTIVGRATATAFNTAKNRGPATALVILGLLYCSVTRSCRLGDAKRAKYMSRIWSMISTPVTTSKQLEQLAGNLCFAAWVEPFCRPLLSCVFSLVVQDKPTAQIIVPPFTLTALRIWHEVLRRNRGLSYQYIRNKYPAVLSPIFVDASTSWGIGGVHGCEYFSIPHGDLQPFICRCPGWESYPQVPVARLELLAALVAVQLFVNRYPKHLIVLYSDNSNVVAWLGTRRSPNPTVCTIVAAIEQIKYHSSLKLSVRFIPSNRNRTADRLSRNRVPAWLRRRGSALIPHMNEIANAANRHKLLNLWSSCF